MIGLGFGLLGLGTLAVGKLGIYKTALIDSTIMLIVAISWGIGTAIQERVRWEMPAIAVAGWQLLLGGLPTAITAILLEHYLWPEIINIISVDAILSTILILIYPIIFCWIAWFHIVSKVPVPVSAISIMLVPVIGVFSGHVILQELWD